MIETSALSDLEYVENGRASNDSERQKARGTADVEGKVDTQSERR